MRKHDSLVQSTDHIDEPRSADFLGYCVENRLDFLLFGSNMAKFRPAAPYRIKTRYSLKH